VGRGSSVGIVAIIVPLPISVPLVRGLCRDVEAGRVSLDMIGERHSSRTAKEAGVKYLLLIYHNPQARQIWETFSEEEKAEGLALYAALNNDLAASGELIVAEALEDPSAASRVSVTDGQTVAGDGPYVETKEHLAGFYLVDVDSRERAIEIAGRIPEAAIGGVEVRPILTYSAFEM